MGRETSPVWWLEGMCTCDPNIWKAKKGDFRIPGICTNPGQRKSPEASGDSQSLAGRKKSGPRPVLKSTAQ